MSGYSDVSNGSLVAQSMAGFFARSKSAELDYKTRPVLVSRSRILSMSSTIAKAVVNTLVRGVVGSGLRLELSDKSVVEGFEMNSLLKGFDYDRDLDFYQLQQQAFETMLVSGECWLFRITDQNGYSSWKVREPDHVRNPLFVTAAVDGRFYYKNRLIVDGVEMDAKGRPKYVWFCANPYNVNLYDRKAWDRIPLTAPDGMPNVLHVYRPDRAGYPRGVPVISPVLDLIWSTLSYTESEIQMGILQSCSAYVVKTNTNRTLDPFSALSKADLSAQLVPTTPGGSTQPTEKPAEFTIVQPPNPSALDGLISTTDYIRPGCSHHLAPDEEVQMLSPTAPSTNLEGFYTLVVQQVGAALGVPAQCLSGTYEASYSAAKASFADFAHTCTIYRRFVEEKLLKPILQVYICEHLQNESPVVDKLRGGHPDQENWALASAVALRSQWRSVDKEMILDETKVLDYYIKAIENGLIDRQSVANILFGVKTGA